MNTDLTFDRSGTGPACRRAGRVPSLPMHSIHPPRQAAIPDGGRSPSGFLPFRPPPSKHPSFMKDNITIRDI